MSFPFNVGDPIVYTEQDGRNTDAPPGKYCGFVQAFGPGVIYAATQQRADRRTKEFVIPYRRIVIDDATAELFKTRRAEAVARLKARAEEANLGRSAN